MPGFRGTAEDQRCDPLGCGVRSPRCQLRGYRHSRLYVAAEESGAGSLRFTIPSRLVSNHVFRAAAEWPAARGEGVCDCLSNRLNLAEVRLQSFHARQTDRGLAVFGLPDSERARPDRTSQRRFAHPRTIYRHRNGCELQGSPAEGAHKPFAAVYLNAPPALTRNLDSALHSDYRIGTWTAPPSIHAARSWSFAGPAGTPSGTRKSTRYVSIVPGAPN
jgi:hypothetical protein